MIPILPPADDPPPKKKLPGTEDETQSELDEQLEDDEGIDSEDEPEEDEAGVSNEQLEEEWESEDWESDEDQEEQDADGEDQDGELEPTQEESASTGIIARVFGFGPVEQLDEEEDQGDPDELVTITTFRYVHEAELARMHLENEGIQAFIMDAETITMDWLLGNAIGNIKLQVARSQKKAALELLERWPKPVVKDEDDETENMTCLSCGAAMTADQSHCPTCGWSYHEERIQE
ncbi:MAG: DUF2007 domain-containing protein [Gemmataceae bacterium]|nr:DUF2007 domain-containing protein [Gemmataceae bacterium]MCI0739699.1 DUF2007 domain-containing protein [Gemmataceae bacterium]